MRRETVLVLGLVGVLAIVVGMGQPSTQSVSPVAAQSSAGGFTILAGVLAILVGTHYKALLR